MKTIRLTIFFVCGLLLGGLSVSAFASATFQSNSGTNLFNRNPDGTLAGVNTSSGAGLLTDLLNKELTVRDEGRFSIPTPGGGSVSTPGTQSVKIPGGALSKAAAAAAWLGKGAVGGAVVGYLLSEGIQLLESEWKKPSNSPVYPDAWYQGANSQDLHKDVQAAMDSACAYMVSTSGGYGPYINQVKTSGSTTYFTCNGEYTRTDGVKGYLTFSNQSKWPIYKCDDGRFVASQDICSYTLKPVPVTQTQLEEALDKRAADTENALKDYYRAISDSEKSNAIKSGTVTASANSVSGQPTVKTTTNPDGSTKTTSTTNTYNIVHQGNTYNTSTISVVTTTTTNYTQGGNTTTTTQTSPGAPTTEDKPTDCESNPQSVGCSEFGDVSDSDLPVKNLEGSIVPVDVGGPGQCPPPLTAAVHGFTVAIPFDAFCQFSDLIRAGVILVAWVASVFILVGVIRE